MAEFLNFLYMVIYQYFECLFFILVGDMTHFLINKLGDVKSIIVLFLPILTTHCFPLAITELCSTLYNRAEALFSVVEVSCLFVHI